MAEARMMKSIKDNQLLYFIIYRFWLMRNSKSICLNKTNNKRQARWTCWLGKWEHAVLRWFRYWKRKQQLACLLIYNHLIKLWERICGTTSKGLNDQEKTIWTDQSSSEVSLHHPLLQKDPRRNCVASGERSREVIGFIPDWSLIKILSVRV